jgi:uncharacterized protein YrrD
MLRVSSIYNVIVVMPKAPKKARDKKSKPQSDKGMELTRVGKIHMVVFSPDGHRVVGFLVRRPDIAGMVKREDLFLGFDSYNLTDKAIYATKGKDSFDEVARERLSLNWDACIMWTGMDAKTTNDQELGYVNDVSFDEHSGFVKTFFIGDGGVAQQLVGSIEVPVSMLHGYADGYMIVDPAASQLRLNGGFASKAGEATAKAKLNVKQAGGKISVKAETAVDRGSLEFGKIIGETKRAFKEASDEPKQQQQPMQEALDVSIEATSPKLNGLTEDVEPSKPTTYIPVSELKNGTKTSPKTKKKASKRNSSAGDTTRAIGRQFGKLGKAFGEFTNEYKRANK